MNFLCAIVEFILVITYGKLVFGLNQFPVWAIKHLNSTNVNLLANQTYVL